MDLNDLLSEVDGIGDTLLNAASQAKPAAAIMNERPAPAPAPMTTAPRFLEEPAAAVSVFESAPVATAVASAVQLDEPPAPRAPQFSSLDMILDVELEVLVELGQARLPLKRLLAVQPGDSFALDGRADSPLKIFVNDRLVAYGEPLVVDGSLAIRLVELLPGEAEG